MNEVPLIQNVQKNDINTSIIAIKKQLKELNAMLGLIDTSSDMPDLSPYIKKTDVTNEVQRFNLNPVTSNAVSQSLSYSTTEQKTGGVWIDGKMIYRKVIDIGTLPSTAGVKQIAHNISNLAYVVSLKGIALNTSTNGNFYPLPWATGGADSTYNIGLYTEGANVGVQVGRDRHIFTAKAIIEYTKTTDN